MKHVQANLRSGASQASTLTSEEGYEQTKRNWRLAIMATAPGGAKPEFEPVMHTAGGTTSDRPRQIDRQ